MTGFESKREAAADKLQEPDWKTMPKKDAPLINWANNQTPPQRKWVGLTEKDFSAINQSCLTKLQAATSAESILKEKNS